MIDEFLNQVISGALGANADATEKPKFGSLFEDQKSLVCLLFSMSKPLDETNMRTLELTSPMRTRIKNLGSEPSLKFLKSGRDITFIADISGVVGHHYYGAYKSPLGEYEIAKLFMHDAPKPKIK